MSTKFGENKKLFWREVRKQRGGERKGSVSMKCDDGVVVGGEGSSGDMLGDECKCRDR